MIQKKITQLGLASFGLTIGISLLSIQEADAKGCNGVVDQMTWGCAAWDNNNGPQYPHYKKPASSSSKPAAGQGQPAVALPKQVVTPNGGNGIISGGAGNVISGGAGNVISGGAGNMRNR